MAKKEREKMVKEAQEESEVKEEKPVEIEEEEPVEEEKIKEELDIEQIKGIIKEELESAKSEIKKEIKSIDEKIKGVENLVKVKELSPIPNIKKYYEYWGKQIPLETWPNNSLIRNAGLCDRVVFRFLSESTQKRG